MVLQKERYDSLDGIRALAAIGIVCMHVLANINLKPSTNYLTTDIIPFMTNFTYMFMMVSAFSMCCGYYDRIKEHSISPNDFYKRRYQRILPFFALMVLIDLVWEHKLSALYEGFADLTLCFNLLPNPDIKVIGVGWFIGTVFTFYLLFPFFTFLINNKKRAWFVFALSLVFTYVVIVYFSSPHFVVKPIDRVNIIYSFPFFLMGGIIYLYRRRLAHFVKDYSWYILLFNVLFTIICFKYKLFNNFVLIFLFGAWLIYALGPENKFLNNRFMKFMSKISMEIYLCHMMWFRIIDKIHLDNFISNNNILYLSYLILVLLGATVFSYFIKFYLFPLLKIK